MPCECEYQISTSYKNERCNICDKHKGIAGAGRSITKHQPARVSDAGFSGFQTATTSLGQKSCMHEDSSDPTDQEIGCHNT